MADVVRLSIVYDTAQAASNLNVLNNRLGISTSAFKKAGLGALALANAVEVGSISAVGMASNLSRVASILLGPWGIALALAVAGLTFFTNKANKARDEARKFADQLRDVQRDVDKLLNPGQESPFAAEIQRLSDLILTLDRQVEDMQNSWLRRAQNFLATVGINIPGFPQFSFKAAAPGPSPAEGQRSKLQSQLNRLMTTDAELQRYNSLVEQQGRLLGAINEGQFPALESAIKLLQEHMDNLSRMSGPEAAEALKTSGIQLHLLTERLRQAERASALLKSGLETIADTIEDFVVTGTIAFTDFLNSILRLLYRDFTSELIHGIVRSAGFGGGSGSASPGSPVPVMGNPGGGITGSLQTNVNFTVNAIDAQGVAQFLTSNGPAIAAVVANQADRSRAIRRRFFRG